MRPSSTPSCYLAGLFLTTALVSTCGPSTVDAFGGTVFQETPPLRRTTPSKTNGVEIELPDFDEMFRRIQLVSPLARLAIEGRGAGEGGGFAAMDDRAPPNMKWKVLESNKRSTIHRIDKIDNFQNLGPPILRFRSSLKGPCVSMKFADFIMNLDERKRWDPQIADVAELYPIYDLAAANLAMGVGRYGDCSRLGVGYCQTKPNLVADAREQLTLCGIQDFQDGSALIWGTEMEEWHNHLLPDGPRHTRAKSHLFSTVLVPTGPDSFDVEYVLQLEIGGKIPAFLTTPIVTQTVKSLFNHAKDIYSGRGGELERYVREMRAKEDALAERSSILMTP